MKSFMLLFAIIFFVLSGMEAEPLQLPVLRRIGLRHLIPYRTQLGLQPIHNHKCNRHIMMHRSPMNSLHHTFLLNSDTAQNDVSLQLPSFDAKNSPTRRILDGDFANIDLEAPMRFSGTMNDPAIEKWLNFNLKSDKPNPGLIYLHKMGTIPELLISEYATAKGTVIDQTAREAETMITQITAGEVDSVFSQITDASDLVINQNTEDIVSEGTVINTNSIEYTPYGRNYVNREITYSFDLFEQKLYMTNYNKFLALTPASKGSSGMSFVQSGLLLEMSLLALSTEVDVDTKNEIDNSFGLDVSDVVKIALIKQTVDSFPNCTETLKFVWSSRLVLRRGRRVSEEFRRGAANALHLKINHFAGHEGPEAMAEFLNKLIEHDSEGAIRDTFEEEDLSDEVEAVFMTTLYFRARWRSAPTLLNGTWLFRDSDDAPSRSVRMIRINDVMKYVDLPEWDAEAVEISYMTPGLSLLIFVPRKNSLNYLAENLTNSKLTDITERMQTIRIAATMPLYTLRMTLLLPNKLQTMGMSRIVDTSEADGSLRLSHAVQRIMFWAEAGRNAFKDDGFEWDELPAFEIVVDRPYIFFVRWQDLTLMNGNFVL